MTVISACQASVAIKLHLTGSIDAGTLLVAAATFVLAFLTWRLARATAASVQAAQSSADAERLSIEAMAMPFIVVVPQQRDLRITAVELGGRQPELQLDIRLLNIGSGPGIVEEVRLDSTDAWVKFESNQIPLAAGAEQNAYLLLKAWPDTSGAQFRVRYRHSNGRGYVTIQDVHVEDHQLQTFTLVRKLDDGPMPGGRPFDFPMPEGTRHERDSPI
ncbi:MAG TPA: hypothetical protein VMB05_03840 [Solirubrobacteraceae bacterium]|nr:hypothetical protein [Solirubrobacteraceae bacterium]